MPFGEYFPLKFITKPLLKSLDISYSNLTAGSSTQPTMHFDQMKIQPLICYDAAYTRLVAKAAKNTAVLAIISDDSWFGESSALDQQLQMAQMRALETGRFILIANNTGITAIVNNKGKIMKSAPTHKQSYLKGYFRRAFGSTPYMIWGYYAVWILILMMIIFGLIIQKKPLDEDTKEDNTDDILL